MEATFSATINGLETFAFREGKGPPLIMLHGMAATSDCWTYAFDALKADHTVVAPDLPGHGRSEGHTHPYGLSFYLRWLDGLLDALALKKVTLMGNSMGGAISLAYAMTHPARVERLILVDALGLSGRIPWSTAWRMISHLPYFAAAMLTRRADPYLFRYFQPWAFVNPWGPPREIITRMAALNRRRGFWSFGAGARLLLTDFLPSDRRLNFVQRLGGVAVPTLIAWGRHDGLLPVANAFAGAERLPDARLRIFESSAHAPMLEEPEAFNATVREFLSDSQPVKKKRRQATKKKPTRQAKH